MVDRIVERRLTWFRHISRMGSEQLPAEMLHCSVNGRREQGRQPKKWIDNVKRIWIQGKYIFNKQCLVYITEANGNV